MHLGNMELKVYLLKTLFTSLFIFYTFVKIMNYEDLNHKMIIKSIIYLCFISIITTIIKYNFNAFMAIVGLSFGIGIIGSRITRTNVGYSILVSIISSSLNYISYVIVVFIAYLINKIYFIKNEYINLFIIMSMQALLLYCILKIKRFKKGISFFYKTNQDEYFDIIILNISVVLLFSFIILVTGSNSITISLLVGFIIFAIIMIITIQKSIQLYYKHKLLVRELEETQIELNNKNKEIEKLEQENLNFSKKSHTLAHKQRVLEHKINKLMLDSEIAEELDVKDRLDNISKELYEKKAVVNLPKTGIEVIDDMLDFMQSECENNNIDFDLKIFGNIYYMTNHFISKEDLETLLADHIKDAIIAINHTDNINRSILVKLGNIDDCYGLYIYDSGIEFEKETLDNLGKKPSTTHSDEGGTGMGFMNTFDTLRKYQASLIINEIGKPSKENFTKILMFKFDGKNEFKVISYKDNENE